MLQKNRNPLTTLEDWRVHAPPKKSTQWQDDRCAKESAGTWVGAISGIPREIAAILDSDPAFGPLQDWTAEPEAQVSFDAFGGPANLHVLLRGRDERGPVVIVVEAKADERFGPTIDAAWAAAEVRLADNPRSKGIARLEQLLEAVLGVGPEDRTAVGHLRYQLLTATAALLATGPGENHVRRVLLIHEFVTDRTADQNHASNAADLDAFVRFLSGDDGVRVGEAGLIGPLMLPGAPLWEPERSFWCGGMLRK